MMTQAEVFELLVKHTREVIPGLEQRQFEWQDRLVDLGANSVDRVEIVAMTLSSLALRLPLVKTQGANNIGELAELLHERL
jgi:polyketide biosynthesis acyl carrier protein|nr:polyketide biosynthesis acyl-carrier-protein AcpK [Pseudomonas sp. QS1027]